MMTDPSMMPPPQPADDPNAALIQALARLGMLGGNQSQLATQQGQNAAYMAPQAGQHSTGMGALGGGLGDMVRAGVGAYRQNGLNAQAQGLNAQATGDKATSLQAILAQALRAQGGQGGGAQPQAMGDFPDPFGLGARPA